MRVYADNAATTAVSDAAVAAMFRSSCPDSCQVLFSNSVSHLRRSDNHPRCF